MFSLLFDALELVVQVFESDQLLAELGREFFGVQLHLTMLTSTFSSSAKKVDYFSWSSCFLGDVM